MTDLFTSLSVTVETLSPVHIGNGSELLRGIDYVLHRGQTWVVDQDAILERNLTGDDYFDDRLLGVDIAQLLANLPDPYNDQTLFRYVMPDEPINRPIRAHVKDVYGRPYLPGSTLKGLLRTLFVWGEYAAYKRTPDLERLGKSRTFAAQPAERDVMGTNPNYDLFRALRVGDSQPVALDRLRVVPVSIFPTGNRESRGVVVDVEALGDGTVFTSQISIDEYGFENSAARQRLNWGDKRAQLDRIARFGHVFAGRRLAEEIEYFQRGQETRTVTGFYNRLVRIHEQLGEGQFLAQLGWGTGWNSKTLNDLLRQDKHRFAKIVREYRLTKFYRDFEPGDPFPKSRHLAQVGGALIPSGWVVVTFKND
jgi:CRISPR-associated protein Csm5